MDTVCVISEHVVWFVIVQVKVVAVPFFTIVNVPVVETAFTRRFAKVPALGIVTSTSAAVANFVERSYGE